MSRPPVRLHCNENCYGPSRQVLEAIRSAATDANRYPHPDGLPLRIEIARRIGVPVEQIILGHGSSELIDLLARTFLDSETNCVSATETFPVFRSAVLSARSNYVSVPLRNYVYDLSGMQEVSDHRTRLVLIANPNNPTGTLVSPAGLRAFLEDCPPNILVVLDEAYGEYLEDSSFRGGLEYLRRFANVVLLRTFSKAYGLAGLRLGYAVAREEVIARLNSLRLPFNISVIAQAAGIAALQDNAHVEMSRTRNAAERAFLKTELARLGFESVPSVTNFILVPAKHSGEMESRLAEKGVLVANMEKNGIPDSLRITVGTRKENEFLLSALKELLSEGN